MALELRRDGSNNSLLDTARPGLMGASNWQLPKKREENSGRRGLERERSSLAVPSLHVEPNRALSWREQPRVEESIRTLI